MELTSERFPKYPIKMLTCRRVSCNRCLKTGVTWYYDPQATLLPIGPFPYLIVLLSRRYSSIPDPGLDRDGAAILNSIVFDK